MSLEEFQDQTRLYVIGALEPDELAEFEAARKRFGPRAERVITECLELQHASALTLKPVHVSAEIKDRLMLMMRERLGR